MPLEQLILRVDAAAIVDELKSISDVAGYEVTFPDGAVCLYGVKDKPYVEATFGLDPEGHFKVEPLYKFKRIETDPNQPGLFDAHTKDAGQ